MTRLSDAMIRIEENTRTMKDEMLPPVTKAAAEARDGVLRLGVRVENLETNGHVCSERERQARQDTDIAELKPQYYRFAGTVKWAVGILTSVVVVFAGAAVGFYGSTYSITSKTSADVSHNAEKIQENSTVIKELGRQQASDRQLFIREVKSLPRTISQQEMSVDDVEVVFRGTELNRREKETLRSILRKARSKQEK